MSTLFPSPNVLIYLCCEEARRGFHLACTHKQAGWSRGLSNILTAARCSGAESSQEFESQLRTHGHVLRLFLRLQVFSLPQSLRLASPPCTQFLPHLSQ